MDNSTKFVLHMHIPPGLIFSDGGGLDVFWNSTCLKSFMSLLNTYQDRISMILGAHVHTFEIRSPLSSSFPNVSVPLLMSPSISPLHENNPGYSVMDFGVKANGSLAMKHEMRFFQLNDYTVFHDIEFITTDIQEKFHVSFLSSDSIRGLENRLSENMNLYERFQVLRMGFPEESMSFDYLNNETIYVSENAPLYLCSMRHYEVEAYNSCIAEAKIE